MNNINNPPKMGKFVVARHHESEWNKLGLWTGTRDVHLTAHGFEMSAKMGEIIQDIHIDQAFTSKQVRAQETLKAMLTAMHQSDVPVIEDAAVNERDYGDYTGKNKWEVQKDVGKEKFDCIRRDWDEPVPNGETLKMVYARAVPYYLDHILPVLREGKNVLLAAHGNSIRALMKFIESLPDKDICKIEMLFGAVLIYTLDNEGHMIGKEVREVKSHVNA